MLAKEAALLHMSRLMLSKEAAMLLAAVCAGEGTCAAACCGECKQKRLRYCLLWWVWAREAALRHAEVGGDKGGCASALLLAVVVAKRGGCVVA
jgi:hypothetical protein